MAEALQWHLLDSGAIYRDWHWRHYITMLMLRRKMRWYAGIPSGCTFCVDQWQSGSDPEGEDVSGEIRTQEVANAASQSRHSHAFVKHYCVANARFAITRSDCRWPRHGNGGIP